MRQALFIWLMIYSFGVSAQEISNVRVIVVNWEKSDGYDGDVQVCDDQYYNGAEILVPQGLKNPGLVVADQCPNMKIKSIESTYLTSESSKTGMVSGYYTRIRLEGTWNCAIVFEKPLTVGDKNKAKFTVELGGGC